MCELILSIDILDEKKLKGIIDATEKDINWFKNTYLKLEEIIKKNTYILKSIKKYQFMLTNSFELVSPSEAKIVKDLNIPKNKLLEFKVINQDICKDSEVENFLVEMMQIKFLTKDEIDKLERENLIYNEDQWINLTDEEKIENIQNLKKHQESIAKALTYITIPTKDGGWEKARELVFPHEYAPDYNIEGLISKRLIKKNVPKFVSPKLLEKDNDIYEWRKFLIELGCQKPELIKKIAEEVAIESVIIYEQSKNNIVSDPRSIGINEFLGYDLKSESIDKIKLIEVKGISDNSKIFKVTLSRNEYEALYSIKNANEANYVYVVKNVLNSPEINIFEGDDVKEITAQTTIIYNELEKYKKEDSITVFSLIN